MKKILACILAAAAILALAACGGSAGGTGGGPAGSAASDSSGGGEDWPLGAVTVTIPYGAGGDTDTYCRTLFQRIQEKTGGIFIITNLTGNSGVAAATDVMNKPADGKTLLFNHTGASLVQEAIGAVDFSYTRDFANCCTVAIDETYSLVVINQDGRYGQYSRGWRNLEDMLADARANPGAIRYSTVFGSLTEYVGTMLERQAGVTFDNIDVGTSSGDRVAALLDGRVDILAANYMNVRSYVESGDMICLGVMSKERVDGIDSPTFIEQGYDKVVSAKKYEIKFPKGTDPAIVNKLAELCREVVEEDPAFAETLGGYFAKPLYRDAATMDAEDPAEVEALKAVLAG